MNLTKQEKYKAMGKFACFVHRWLVPAAGFVAVSGGGGVSVLGRFVGVGRNGSWRGKLNGNFGSSLYSFGRLRWFACNAFDEL